MNVKQYVYRLSEEELEDLLLDESVARNGLEVLERLQGEVIVATYEPLEGYRPTEIREVSKDWESWKENFRAVEADDFVILPPWKRAVFINPGMAFGTGLHPTTRMCVRMLKDCISVGDSVLDVGSGSGILSIVAKMLGAGRVLAIDVSEEAVRETVENARLNGIDLEARVGTAREVEETFDVVVANLELKIFREELDGIIPRIGGIAVFSGIYRRDELEEFTQMLDQHYLKPFKILEEDEWFCLGVGDGRNKKTL